MPNEFSGLEQATSRIGKIASNVDRWASNLNWEAPDEYGQKNIFKGIKNFAALNEKYAEQLNKQGQEKRSLINVLYLAQRIIIISNALKVMNEQREDYAVVVRMRQQLAGKKGQKKGTFEDEELKEREQEVFTQIKSILNSLGIYRQYANKDTFFSDRVAFINGLISDLQSSLVSQKRKYNAYKKEVELGTSLPKKQKAVVTPAPQPQQPQQQAKDIHLTAGPIVGARIKFKSK